MYLSYPFKTRTQLFKNCTQLTRSLYGAPKDLSSKKEPRGVPLAKDLDGISLSRTDNAGGNGRKGYIPKMKDVGQTAEYVERLLSTRLNRRLSPVLRTGPGPERAGLEPRRSFPESRRLPPLQQRMGDGRVGPRPRTLVPGTRPVGRQPGGQGRLGGVKSGSHPRTREPRTGNSRFRSVDTEPDVPVPPSLIPSRVFDLTSLPTLKTPIRALTARDGQEPSNIVLRVRETIGGDYSGWMSKEDVEAAGKSRGVTPMARAKLALAFNSSVSPKKRKRLLATASGLMSSRIKPDEVSDA